MMSRPKKSSKSLDAACNGLWMMSEYEGENGPEGYSAAGRKSQARKVIDPAQKMLTPQSKAYSTGLVDLGFRKFRDTIVNPRNDALWEVIPYDAEGVEGVNPSWWSCDEYAVFVSSLMRDNLSTAMIMRENPLGLTISTKGDRAGGPFYDLEQVARKLPDFEQVSPYKWIAQDRDAGFLFINYGLEEDDDTTDIEDPAVWNGINQASWITEENLGLTFRSHSTSTVAFRRKHLNQWVGSSEEAGVPPTLWDRAKRTGYQLPAGTAVCLGIDIGFTDDWSAVVAAGWDGDKIGLDHVMFEPPEDAGMELDTAATVGETIMDMCARYRVVNIGIDQYQMRMLMQALGRSGLPVEKFPGSPSYMCPASVDFLGMLLENKIMHDGDPDLRQHILNAVKRTVGMDGWMFSKPKASEGKGTSDDRTLKIDGLVATLIAVARLLAKGRPQSSNRRISMVL
ncbi:MAG: hypothetical protein H7123_05620 [Thermoleophilia bacterium]|nr:hypothetical protein [Thermoleophilia bacterium]